MDFSVNLMVIKINLIKKKPASEEEEDGEVEEEDCEIIHTKYVVGCDGAHSWVRKQLDIDMEGEQTDFVWGF